MKDAEDEAFDELAKRQGHWGGGFMAKKAMAADKLQEPTSGDYALGYAEGFNDACKKPAQEPVCDKDPQGCWNVRCQLGKQCKNLAQPVQPQQDESDLLTIAYQSGFYEGKKAALAQPAQEPVAYVTGMSFGRFIVEPLNPAMVLPVGMALYSSPQGNK